MIINMELVGIEIKVGHEYLAKYETGEVMVANMLGLI